ncbi:RNA polymerase sigma factor [Gemmatirosa kalamazoonensis]|jgi:RNA polymerase sigma-70 factor (ECF subfamily)|nr:sigma-70 family RNA polymerase sigma factor [Gemmatirosa kalamazoonensis]
MMVAIQDSLPPYDVQQTPTEPTDAALAAGGDRRAFERLYRAHVGRVYALCARMAADRALAEELTQDVFVRVWEKLASFRGESSFGTWIHRVAVNVVLNRLQAEKRDRKRSASSDDEDDGIAALPARPTAPGDRMDLERAIAALPPGARRVFVLHDVEGFRHEEIAEQLGITSGGSKAQLHRARLLLREALNA